MIEIMSIQHDRTARRAAEHLLCVQIGIVVSEDPSEDCFDVFGAEAVMGAFENKALVGAGAGKLKLDDEFLYATDVFFISSMAVLPGREECGDYIGSKLLVALELAAQHMGARSIELFSLSDAHGFYDVHGYDYEFEGWMQTIAGTRTKQLVEESQEV